MDKNIERALDIYSVLATGKSISAKDKETEELYNIFYSESEIYDLVVGMLKRLNLKLYEYNEAIFVTAGSGNRVFGYTNDDLKKMLGLRLNKELYLVYIISYELLLQFYKTSDTYQVKDYIRGSYVVSDEEEGESLKSVAYLWDGLPPMISEDKDRNKASRGSRLGFVKLTLNLLVSEGIVTVIDDRIYPTDRFHAIAENYFEDNGSAIYDALSREAPKNQEDEQD